MSYNTVIWSKKLKLLDKSQWYDIYQAKSLVMIYN